MSSTSTPFVPSPSSWRRRFKRFFRGKWLTAWFASVRRMRRRWQRSYASCSHLAGCGRRASRYRRVCKAVNPRSLGPARRSRRRSPSRPSDQAPSRWHAAAAYWSRGSPSCSRNSDRDCRHLCQNLCGSSSEHWVGLRGACVGVFFVFVGRWFRTRQYWHLAGRHSCISSRLAVGLLHDPHALLRQCSEGQALPSRQLGRRWDAKDYEAANLYFRKLYQLGAMNDAAEFQAALNAYESGDMTQAVEKMKELAPEDQPGYPPRTCLAGWPLPETDRRPTDRSAKEVERLDLWPSC